MDKFLFEVDPKLTGDTEVEYAIATLREKQEPRLLAWDYYYGNHPLRFSTDRLAMAFKNNAKFIQNWCTIVVDAVVDRIELEGFTVDRHEGEEKALNDFFEAKNMSPEVYQAVLAMVATGEGYIIGETWDYPEEEGGKVVKAFYSPPEYTHVFYEPDDPSKKKYACKTWAEGDKSMIMLYYPDRFELYSYSKQGESPVFVEGTVNPWSPTIPIWHLTADKSAPRPDFSSAVPVQDAINKLFSDMMVTGDFTAFPFRWAISSADFSLDEAEQEGSHPFRLMQFPPAVEGEQNAQVGEWSAGDSSSFLAMIDSLTLAFSSITRTPRHYFTTVGGDPSGEALQAQEAPLIRKVKRYISVMRQEWQEFGAWVLENRARVENIYPIFADVRTFQLVSEAQARHMNVQAGIPIITQLRDEGWRDKDIDAMLADRQLEAASKEALDPEAAHIRMEAAVDRLSERMLPMAEAAMQAVRDGALEALVRSGALDRLLGQPRGE